MLNVDVAQDVNMLILVEDQVIKNTLYTEAHLKVFLGSS